MKEIFSQIGKFFFGTKSLTRKQEDILKVDYINALFSEFQNEFNMFLPHQSIINVNENTAFSEFLTNIANSTIPIRMHPIESKYAAIAIPICCCIVTKRDHLIPNGVFYKSNNRYDAESIILKAADSVEFISDLRICHLDNNNYKMCVINEISGPQKENLQNFYKTNSDEFNNTIFLFQRDSNRFNKYDFLDNYKYQKYRDSMLEDFPIELRQRWSIFEEGAFFGF